jgi:hypothetical protein
MKTIQTIITAATILFTSTFTFSANRNDNALSIEVIQLINPSCQGGANGSALVEASGGVSPYIYNWNTFPNQYEQLAVNLSAGTYFIHVTDAVGNKFYESIYITDPDKNDPEKEKELTTKNEESLVEINLEVDAPVGPFCMKLNGEVTSFINYNELEVGLYKLEIIDGNNCVTTSIIQVFEYEPIDPEDLLKMKSESKTNPEYAQPKMQLVSIHDR